MDDAFAAIIECAYSPNDDAGEWLANVVRACADALGHGVIGNLVERREDGSLGSAHVALSRVADEWIEPLQRTAKRMSSTELARRFTTGVTFERGVLALSARADERTAVLFDAPLDDDAAPALDLWREIAEHLAAALRLRGDAGDATSVWYALLEGRLAIAHRFDREGRRFVVVRPANAGERDALTARERQVLAHVARGHANKRIALDLGLSESTVSAAMRSAARKLGVRSRVELARILGPPSVTSRS